MRRLWPVGLSAAAAVHAIATGNAAGFIVSLYFGVIYAAVVGLTAPHRRGGVPPLTPEQLYDRGAPPWPLERTRWEDLYREDAEGEAVR